MKLVVFMPIIIFMVVFLILIAGFIFLVLKIVLKTRNSSWKGEVIDKSFNTKRDMDSNRKSSFYTLVVKTDEGLTRKIAVNQAMYNSCEVGDKLEKPLGKLNPVKV